jgi:hypothetical protein
MTSTGLHSYRAPPHAAGFFVITTQMPVWLAWIRYIRWATELSTSGRTVRSSQTRLRHRAAPRHSTHRLRPSARSPFYWGIVSLMNNEFQAPEYSAPAPSGSGGGSGGESLGKLFISQFGYPFSDMSKWGGESGAGRCRRELDQRRYRRLNLCIKPSGGDDWQGSGRMHHVQV